MSAAVIDLAKFEVTYLPTRVTLAECAPSVTVSVPPFEMPPPSPLVIVRPERLTVCPESTEKIPELNEALASRRTVRLVCEAAEVKLMTVPKTETPAKSMNWTWLAWATPPNPVIFPV